MNNFDFDGLMGAFSQHNGDSADGPESMEAFDPAFFQAGPDYVHLSAEEQQSSQWASIDDSALVDPAYFDSPFEEPQLEETNTKLSEYPLVPMDGGLLPPFDPSSFEWTCSSAPELTSDDMGSKSPPYHVIDDLHEDFSSSPRSSEPPIAAPTRASDLATVAAPLQAAGQSPIQHPNSAQLTVNAVNIVEATDANPSSELATAMAEIQHLKAVLVKNTQQFEATKQTKLSPKGPKTTKKGPASKSTASSISPRKRATVEPKESPPKKLKQLPPAAIALAAEVGPIEAKWSPKHKTFREANASLVKLVSENFPQVPPTATKKISKRTKAADLSEPKKQPPIGHLPQPPYDGAARQSVGAVAQSTSTKPKKSIKPMKPLKATRAQQKKQIPVPHLALLAYDGFAAADENVEESILQSIETDENDPFSIMMRNSLVQELHGSIIAEADSAVTPQAKVDSSFTQAHGPTQDFANAAAYATYLRPPASSSTPPQETQHTQDFPSEAHYTTMSNPVEHTPQESVEPTGWTAAPVLRQRTTTPDEIAEPTNNESTFEFTITPDETVVSDVESEHSYPSGSCVETMTTNPLKHGVSTKITPVKTTIPPTERPIEELMKENFHSLSDVEKVRIFLPLKSGYDPREFWETETWDPTLKARWAEEARQAEMFLQNNNHAAIHQAEKHAQQQNAMRTQAVQLETQAAAMYTHAAAMQAHAAKLHADANHMQIGYDHTMMTGYSHPMQNAYGSSMQTGFGQFNETPEQFGARRQREAVEKSQHDAAEMARRMQVQQAQKK